MRLTVLWIDKPFTSESGMQRRSTIVCASLSFCLWWLVFLTMATPGSADVNELSAGHWSGGGGIGFMASTPDGVAELGFHGHADYFVTERFSYGPLAQYADDVL